MTSPAQFVRELWDAHAAGGMEAFLDAAGEDVIWQPHISGGRIYRSTSELREAMAVLRTEGMVYEVELEGLEQHDDVVVASGRLRFQRNGAMHEHRVHWAYHFREGRLWRQSTHASRDEAVETLKALRTLAANFAIAEAEGDEGEQIVRVEGELDIATAPDLERVLLSPRARGQRVVIDLAGLRFMDSTGLRVLLRAQAAAKDGRWEVYVRNVPPNITRLFTIAGVQDALPSAERFAPGD
jgi:anti-sigma B factor antagonist